MGNHKSQSYFIDFQDVVTNGMDAILITDQKGVIKFVNPRAEIFLNRSADALVGEVFAFFTGTEGHREIDIHRSVNDPGFGDMYTMATRWKTLSGYLVTIRDITRKKQTERVLRQTIAELKEANQKVIEQQKSVIEEERLNVLLQIAGATAHELNQPLMALLGNIEIMRLNDTIPKQMGQYMGRIEAAGRRINEIIKKMYAVRHDEPKSHPGGGTIINLDQKIKMLMMAPTEQDVMMVKNLLVDQENLSVTRAPDFATARDLLADGRFDLFLLGETFTGKTCSDILAFLEKEKIEIPVIVLTSDADELVASRLIKAGAYDLLSKKDLDAGILSRSIIATLEKYRLKEDVVRANEEMVKMATRDKLTGIYNRYYMNEIVEKEFRRALRYDTDLACLLIDMDFFKGLNDAHGHYFGDYVLQQFGTLLSKNIRESDTCFRYGGEEFMVLLPNADITSAERVAEKIRGLCELQPFDDGYHRASVTVSIGAASLKLLKAERAQELLAFADKALFRAKAEGRNRVKVYHEDLDGTDTIKDFRFLKDHLAAVMEKTKNASVESFELMVRDMGGAPFREHNKRVLEYFDYIGAKLGFTPPIITSLKRSAVFHDCTKVLLGKMDDTKQLDDDKKERIQEHPYMLNELIEPFDFFSNERSVLLWHHEKYDGSGYPDGLHGDQIPLGARIFAIVDALVAMTSHRSYRPKLTGDEAIGEIVANAGKQFDPLMVSFIIDIIMEKKLLSVSVEAAASARQQLKSVLRNQSNES